MGANRKAVRLIPHPLHEIKHRIIALESKGGRTQAVEFFLAVVTVDAFCHTNHRYVLHTMSAAQIAYELGYADPAHFSRVFARGTGLPPRRFRRQIITSGLPPE